MRNEWIRVRKDRPCPICGKPDWCAVSADGSAVVCGRIESDRPKGEAGYLHRLNDAEWTPNRFRRVKQRKHPCIDFNALHANFVASLGPENFSWISENLGISINSILKFEVGFNTEKNVFTFPMRRPNGSICGVRYRARNGKKFSEFGSKQGLFFAPGSLARDCLLIVEGPTDAMAILDCGYPSVIGRANCRGNSEQIVSLLRRLRPKRVIIIPDNDNPGIDGASLLAEDLRLLVEPKPLLLPNGIKDVRACIHEKKNADWLADQIGELLKSTHPNDRKRQNGKEL